MNTTESPSLEVRDNSAFSDFLTPREVSRRLPHRNGKRIHASTIFRWMSRGCKGVRLQHWRIGRNIYTSEMALMKFFAELADAANQPPTAAAPKRRPRRRSNGAVRQREINAANEVLIKAGILKSAEGRAVEKIGGGR